LFLKFVWKPKDEWKFPAGEAGTGQTPEPARPADPQQAEAEEQVSTLFPSGQGMAERDEPLTAGRVILAWSPWIIMAAFLVVSGFLRERENKHGALDLGFVDSLYVVPVPTLHKEVERAYELQKLVPDAAVPVPNEPDVVIIKEKDKETGEPKEKRVRVQEGP